MSWTGDLTKEQKRELRRVAGLAYDRELSSALTALEEQFRRWRSGEIGAHELSEAIHAYHQGPNRELWSLYSDGSAYLSAAAALARGIVAEHEIDAELFKILKVRDRAG